MRAKIAWRARCGEPETGLRERTYTNDAIKKMTDNASKSHLCNASVRILVTSKHAITPRTLVFQ